MVSPAPAAPQPDPRLRQRTIALVGLMGVGKSSLGRRLAQALDLPFRDADEEIEKAAGRTIPEIFAERGEAEFRMGERRVIARLLDEPPHVLATGGGAFVQPDTRALLKDKALTVWLKADIETLARRVGRKEGRPLLTGKDPVEVLTALAQVRYPAYAEADVQVETGEAPHALAVQAVLSALSNHLGEGRPMMLTVPVGLGDRSYEVMIGTRLLDRAGEKLAPVLPRKRTAIVTDQTVCDHHGERLAAALESAGIAVLEVIALPPGEHTKSFEHLAELSDRLLALGLDRGDAITAFGGGVIGDLAGFAAAIYKRGIDFIQVPTTLLAQVDSSVGGKTAIDTPRGKNMIGAFHQPRLVLADLDVLATLPRRDLASGYAEVIKYGLLGDAGFFAWLEEHGAEVMDRKSGPLAHAVARSIEMKAEIVAEDEKETGRRALLNLGHTFAHALETETGHGDALLHGEAVGIGCALAFRFSAALGLCPAADAERAEKAIAAAGLPVRMPQIQGYPFAADRLIAHMGQDKKAEGGKLTFILARSIGDAFVAKGVEPGPLRDFLLAEGATP